MADLAPGQRVLEVGTGSGYSTAVLAQAVGTAGHVVSLDVNQALVERARKRLQADGLDQVEVYCHDARTGLPERGPCLSTGRGFARPAPTGLCVCPYARRL